MFAEVAVPLYVRQTFTYRLPGEMGRSARVGARVLVPFGKKILTAFIVSLREDLDGEIGPSEIKDVEELLDESPLVTREVLDLTRWMSDYYYAPWGECIRAALPSGATVASEQVLMITAAGLAAIENSSQAQDRPSAKARTLELLSKVRALTVRGLERELDIANASGLVRQLERAGLVEVVQRIGESRLRPKLQNAVRLLSERERARNVAPDEQMRGPAEGQGKRRRRAAPVEKPLTDQQQRVIETLSSAADAMALGDLIEAAQVTASVVRTLEKRGLVEVFPREVRRDPLASIKASPADQITLNDEQQHALGAITAKLEAREYATLLLHGVTGSGKTEIYIRAIRDAIGRGLTALMLVPEISLTPILSRRLRSHFGDALAILHSSLSEGERLDEWRRIKAGDARVVIGTRSAVFAPLENIGVIVVDEEHDTSYKQDETPRYSGRDSAIVRAVEARAVVILGSATPSLESFHNSRSGKYSYVRLNKRYPDRPLAAVETIDMREVFKRHGKQQTLSDELKAAIGETHARGEQSMILLNRRGFSSFLLCRSCGLAVHCPNCDVTLTYHKYNSSLLCHYCNYIRPAPRACDACDGPYIHYVGEGTEQLEARLKELYPALNIARLDRDTTRRRGSFESILLEFEAGTIDMLVGTQMIAKGHDFHNVTLVGVVSVDVGLSLPDFRASERTFQLLTQVAGRAGRGERPGHVLIQTYHPQHYALECARKQDYDEFYRREIEFRRTMHYPPYSALINILVHDKDYDKANKAAAELARELREASRDGVARVLGPAPAPIGRLKGEHRFQVLIKTQNRKRAREALDLAMDRVIAAKHNPRSISVEVDPVSLM
ncbi:MAG TPA: primosomal protein N' [Blastocatellia bacterium]|nr:primosomal protein N' [Blastocatellia bacterium]